MTTKARLADELAAQDVAILIGKSVRSGDYASEAEAKLPLAEHLAEQLAMDIQSGKFPAGHRVREQDLSAMFGVSRGPVREALRILEGDGFVKIEPYRGAIVARASDQEISTALEMQIALFGVAARVVAEIGSDQDMQQLVEYCGRLDELAENETTTPEEFMEMSLRTTWHLIHLAGSASLSKSIRSIRRLTRPDRWILALATKPKQRRAVRQWKELVEAIKARNPNKAESLARARVRQIHNSTL